MNIPNDVTYSDVSRSIDDALSQQDLGFLHERIKPQLKRCPLLGHLFRVWSALQVKIRKSYNDGEDRRLTKDFLAMLRVEGALSMLLVVLEMNPETSNGNGTEECSSDDR